jgi:hypothetical protein
MGLRGRIKIGVIGGGGAEDAAKTDGIYHAMTDFGRRLHGQRPAGPVGRQGPLGAGTAKVGANKGRGTGAVGSKFKLPYNNCIAVLGRAALRLANPASVTLE